MRNVVAFVPKKTSCLYKPNNIYVMKTQIARLTSNARLTARLVYSLSAFALVTMLWACGQQPEPAPAQATITADQYRNMRTSFNGLEGDWSLSDYRQAPLAASLKGKAWIRFTKESADGYRIGGYSFVNHFGGNLRLDETKGLIVVTDGIVQTLIGASEELMQAESRYLGGLAKAQSYELTATGQLVIYLGTQSSPTTEAMVFTRK